MRRVATSSLPHPDDPLVFSLLSRCQLSCCERRQSQPGTSVVEPILLQVESNWDPLPTRITEGFIIDKEASDVLGHPWLCRICYIRSLAHPMIHIIFHRLLSLEAFFKWLPQVSDPRQLQRMSPRSLRTRSRGRTVRVPSSCPSHIRNNARDTCSPCYRDVAQQPRLRGGTGDCTLCESGYHNWVQRGAVGATSINIDNAYPQSSQ